MRYVFATFVCGAVFFCYGLVCLALGFRNLGGAIPLIGLAAVLGVLWNRVVKGLSKPTD